MEASTDALARMHLAPSGVRARTRGCGTLPHGMPPIGVPVRGGRQLQEQKWME